MIICVRDYFLHLVARIPILPNPVSRMQEPVLEYPVTTEIVPLVVRQTDCLLPEPILHAP